VGEGTTMTNRRILLVDDEPGFTQLLRLNLERVGRYELWEANESRDVLETARAFRPDLILMDLSMPDPDGSALAADLHNDPALCHVPVLFLTALASRETIRPQRMGLGRRTYLPKPIDLRRLVAWIDALTAAAGAETAAAH